MVSPLMAISFEISIDKVNVNGLIFLFEQKSSSVKFDAALR